MASMTERCEKRREMREASATERPLIRSVTELNCARRRVNQNRRQRGARTIARRRKRRRNPAALPGGFVAMIKEELGPHWAHICVDMQLLFAPGEDWGPRLAAKGRAEDRQPVRGRSFPHGVFTRFIPARRPGEGQGRWRSYYCRWANLTLEEGGRPLI